MYLRTQTPTKDYQGFDSFFNSFFDDNKVTTSKWIPATDITEDENKYELHFELAGLTKEDININIEKNVLTVSGERKSFDEDKKKNYHRIERHYGRFSRSFTLSDNTNSDEINAEFENGILTVTVPKAEEVKPKVIEIK